MIETVGINGLTLCHKHSDGWVRSTLPDVCKAPTIPVPFVNVAFAKDLAKGTKTVFSHGGAMNGIKGSEFSKSIGDEPGVGLGVKSGTQLHRATWLSWSPDVFMEGKPVTRLTDRMLMNNGNTISAGGYYTGPVKSAFNKPLLDKICGYVCECMAAGTPTQNCVAAKVNSDPANAAKGIMAERGYIREPFPAPPTAWRLYDGPGAPQGRGIPGVVRPDVSDIGWPGAVSPKALVEVKFPNDRYRGTQRADYESISSWFGAPLEDIDMDPEGRPPDCKCEEKKKEKEPVRQPSTSPSPSTAPDPPLFPLPGPGKKFPRPRIPVRRGPFGALLGALQ